MKVNDVAVVEVGGRYVHTFTPKTPNELVSLSHIGGIGDTSITGIQIEKGTVGTPYVEPTVTSDNITGIFEDLRAINVEMTDPKSQFWSSIKINNEAYLQEFGSDMLGSMVGQTADTIYNRVENKISGEYASFELRMAGLQAQVTGDVSQSVSTQLQGLFNNRITDIEGNVSDSLQTINAFQNQITSIDGRLSESIQTVSGFQQQVYGLDGAFSSVKQRVEGLQTEVVDANGNVASLTLLAEGLQAKVTGVNGLESKYTQLSNVIETKVTKPEVEGIIRNSGNDIWLVIKDKVPKMTGSQIVAELALSPDGVRIAGKNITLDGNTFISGAVIKSANIESVVADKITTGKLNAANVDIINLNVSRIVGLNSSFIQSVWNGILSSVKITAEGVVATGNSGVVASMTADGAFLSRAGGSDSSQSYLRNGRLYFRDTDGVATLNIGAHPVQGEGKQRGSLAVAKAEKMVIGRFSNFLNIDSTAPVIPYYSMEYAGAQGDDSRGFNKFHKTLSMNGKDIEDVQNISGFEMSVRATTGRLMLGITGYNTLQIDRANTRSYGNIEMMPGYNVIPSSDKRYKDIVGDTTVNALEEIRRFHFVDYYWKNMQLEKEFGLIAQETPFLSVKNKDGMYGLNGEKRNMLTLLGVQELDKRVLELEKRIAELEGIA